jgi:hypothetical protein
MAKVFTSVKLSDLDIQNMLNLIYNSFGRDFFVKTLYQNKFKDKICSQLSDESFNDLNKILFDGLLMMCNLEETPRKFEHAAIFTKSSFYYFM